VVESCGLLYRLRPFFFAPSATSIPLPWRLYAVELFWGVGYELPALLAGLVVGSLLVYLVLHSRMMNQVVVHSQRMAQQMFEKQKEQLESSFRETYEAKLGEWKATTLALAIEEERADAVDTSRAVLKGKIAEQMAPLLPGFLAKYNPADARFIGSPIDYLIFRGMSKGDDSEAPIEIVLLDVKTGKAGLNGIQRKVQDAAEKKRISFDVLRINESVSSDGNHRETTSVGLEWYTGLGSTTNSEPD
jgi:predicted Holliday junction resolvase-like endonuclease